MRVTVTLALEIPDERVSVKSIDECVAEAMPGFASQAWQKFVWGVEERARRQHRAGGLEVKSHEWRTLWTSVGRVRFKRRRFLSEADGRSVLLFDMRVGIRPWQRKTDLAEEKMAEAAADIPSYEMSARSLGRGWNRAPSGMMVWHAVQAVGRRELEAKLQRRRAVFRYGDLPGWQQPAPEFLAVEADGTYISAWRQKGVDHEVQVGMSYTGKSQRGRRRRLQDKWLCAGLTRGEVFGQDLFAMVQEKHNVTDVDHGLFLSDGAHYLRNIRRNHFPRLTPQLDWAHVHRRLDEAYGPRHRSRSAQVLGTLYRGRRGTACRQVLHDARNLSSRREQLRELRTYLEGPGEDLYGARKLRKSGVSLPPYMNGSGGIERNIGILVVHRMKRRGMSWTRRGAANLLAVRTSLLNRRQTPTPRIT
jgi:hypothetical protein